MEEEVRPPAARFWRDATEDRSNIYCGSDLPQANLTLQQQITNNITFTYVSALDNANAQTIRVEMALTPQWSATAMRDQNLFSANLLYKNQLRYNMLGCAPQKFSRPSAASFSSGYS
jgi:hypothetical protein